MSLKTDYKDYELAPNMGGKKRYRMINNDDGTVSFVDVSEYLEIGDTFKADDINATNNAINEGSLPSNAVVFKDESTPSTPAPRDADRLGGQLPSYYAKASDVNGLSSLVNAMKIKSITSNYTTDGYGMIYFTSYDASKMIPLLVLHNGDEYGWVIFNISTLPNSGIGCIVLNPLGEPIINTTLNLTILYIVNN